VIIFRGCL